MASCNLRNLFLEVWKLAQMYHFLNWVTQETRKEFIWQKRPKYGGDLKISLITVSHMASYNLRNLFLEFWELAQMYHFWAESSE